MASAKEESNPDKNFTDSTNGLAIRLYQHLSKDGGNVFFSPFSVSVAMAMLLRGAAEETEQEMRHILGYEEAALSSKSVHGAFEKLLTMMSKQSTKFYTLVVANGIVHSKNFPLLAKFRYDLRKTYRAEAWEVDFKGDVQRAIVTINEWLKRKTRGMIPHFSNSFDPRTVVVLLNAVYFKGSWKHPFEPEATLSRQFFNKGSESLSKTVPTMTVEKSFRYAETTVYKVLELPYKGSDISMIVLLPEAKDGLSELEKCLNVNFIKSLKKEMHETDVRVYLPRFKMEYSKSLKPIFEKLGLQKIFERGANFKSMSDCNILVSEILHKAVIDVNEEGSEAAAVTEIMVHDCLFIVPEFCADHPFLFLIYDERNGMILFIGRVDDL